MSNWIWKGLGLRTFKILCLMWWTIVDSFASRIVTSCTPCPKAFACRAWDETSGASVMQRLMNAFADVFLSEMKAVEVMTGRIAMSVVFGVAMRFCAFYPASIHDLSIYLSEGSGRTCWDFFLVMIQLNVNGLVDPSKGEACNVVAHAICSDAWREHYILDGNICIVSRDKMFRHRRASRCRIDACLFNSWDCTIQVSKLLCAMTISRIRTGNWM